jgi:uncharacterized protein YajQ (UPF0234 family)
MAITASFDITSPIDVQEVDNAVNQAKKEVAQRYDFKGSRADLDLNRVENTLTLIADDEFKMGALWEVVQTRLVRRNVPVKNLKPGELERAANDTVRRVVTLQQGIPGEAAKDIVKFIKDLKMKRVQAAIQEIRSGSPQLPKTSAGGDSRSADQDFGVALQFGNYQAERRSGHCF